MKHNLIDTWISGNDRWYQIKILWPTCEAI